MRTLLSPIPRSHLLLTNSGNKNVKTVIIYGSLTPKVGKPLHNLKVQALATARKTKDNNITHYVTLANFILLVMNKNY
jgi:hypothetical protein